MGLTPLVNSPSMSSGLLASAQVKKKQELIALLTQIYKVAQVALFL